MIFKFFLPSKILDCIFFIFREANVLKFEKKKKLIKLIENIVSRPRLRCRGMEIGFGLVGFYGISTTVSYLMPTPVYTYILNIYIICNTFCRSHS